MKTTNIDRVYGVSFLLFALLSVWYCIEMEYWWKLVFVLIFSLGLFWVSVKKVKVGFKAQFTLIGGRIQLFVKEGWRFCPPLFGLKVVDCRATTTTLDDEDIFTKDNVEVKLKKPSIVSQVVDLDLYQNLNPENLAGLMDDVVDENVRYKIRETLFEEVLKMKFSVKGESIEHSLDEWGIKILRIIVPDVIPVNQDFIKAQELHAKEGLERDGQTVEMNHIGSLYQELQLKHKLSEERAYETALFITGKANPKNIHEIKGGGSIPLVNISGGDK